MVARMSEGVWLVLVTVISVTEVSHAAKCKGPMWGDECAHICHCKNATETCENHNALCNGNACAFAYGGQSCLQLDAAYNKPTRMNGVKFYPGTGTEAKDLTGKLAVDLNEKTDIDFCAYSFRLPRSPRLNISVDLQRPVDINAVTLLGSDFDHSLKGGRLVIDVDGEACVDRTADYAPPQKETLTCKNARNSDPVHLTGQVVTMTTNRQMIKLCEFAIWECAAGTYGPRCSRQCRCKDPLEVCNRFTGRCSSGCRHAHRQADCQERNVALGRACYTPKYRAATGKVPAGHCGYLTDGLTPSDISFCAETAFKRGDMGWMEVIFDNPNTYVRSVIIYGHHTKLKRLESVEVSVLRNDTRVADRDLVQVCGRQDTPSTPSAMLVVHCKETLVGERVRVSRIGKGSDTDNDLTICEIEVWECADGTFGDKCQHTCNCEDPKEVCHKGTGECLVSGCPPGFDPPSCQKECRAGYWGKDCKSQCHCFEEDAVCRPSDGNCSLGCAPGWTNPGCSQPCPRGKFGMNCAHDCRGCVNNSCDPETGVCKNCPLSPDGVTCVQKCEPFFFGRGCWLECGPCKNYDEKCNFVTGTCESGCEPGYYGHNCKIVDRAFDTLVETIDQKGRKIDTLTDGNLDSCADLATSGNTSAHVTINLPSPVSINKVVLKGKTSGGNSGNKATRYTITVDDDKVCAKDVLSVAPVATIRCTKPTKGVKLKISNTGGPVKLCEVHVMECELYMWGEDCQQQCNCESAAEPCDRLTGICPGGSCREHFKGISCQMQNVAYLKPVQQSSVFFYDKLRRLQFPFFAVDGNLDNSMGMCAVTHNGSSYTDRGLSEQWTVDLNKLTFVNRITVVWEQHSSYTALDTKIFVDGQLCYERPEQSKKTRPAYTEEIFCSTNRQGRKVTFTHPKQVRLCEVQVWECVDGSWGLECDEACKCEDENEICNKFDGTCQARVQVPAGLPVARAQSNALTSSQTAARGHSLTVTWSLLLALPPLVLLSFVWMEQ